jgi:hypothetical protein
MSAALLAVAWAVLAAAAPAGEAPCAEGDPSCPTAPARWPKLKAAPSKYSSFEPAGTKAGARVEAKPDRTAKADEQTVRVPLTPFEWPGAPAIGPDGLPRPGAQEAPADEPKRKPRPKTTRPVKPAPKQAEGPVVMTVDVGLTVVMEPRRPIRVMRPQGSEEPPAPPQCNPGWGLEPRPEPKACCEQGYWYVPSRDVCVSRTEGCPGKAAGPDCLAVAR